MYEHSINILGNGVIVNLPTIFEELKQLDRDRINYKGRLLISDRAHLSTEITIAADTKHETDKSSKSMLKN